MSDTTFNASLKRITAFRKKQVALSHNYICCYVSCNSLSTSEYLNTKMQALLSKDTDKSRTKHLAATLYKY